MTVKPITMKPYDTVRRAAARMRGVTIGCVPIVDEGRLVGIVTVADLLDLLDLVDRGGVRDARRNGRRRENSRPAQTDG